jgi:hypothetical protein
MIEGIHALSIAILELRERAREYEAEGADIYTKAADALVQVRRILIDGNNTRPSKQ